MKIQTSKQMAMLAIVILFAIGLATMALPIPIFSKCFILMAFIWFWLQQCDLHVFLKKADSIKSLDCDDEQRWILKTNDQTMHQVQLSPKSVATSHWMCLYFKSGFTKKYFRVLLSSDSLSKKDWSVLQLLVRFSKPLKN